MEIYVLNKSFQTIWQVEAYNSVIWTNRYSDIGDCELYLPASAEALSFLQKGYFLVRPDDDMVCRINYIELQTDAESGNYLIVKGLDVKSVLDQRIIEGIFTSNGNAEDFIRTLILNALGNTAEQNRQIQDEQGNCIFELADPAGFTEAITEDVSFLNLGERVRDYCKRFEWGYKLAFENGKFVFSLYKGTDRSGYVTFSEEYENIITSTYISDGTDLRNSAFFAGEGEGSNRKTGTIGSSNSGFERSELYVDAAKVSKQITWGALKSAYPSVYTLRVQDSSTGYAAFLNPAKIQIMCDEHLSWLQTNYPNGTVVEEAGTEYYQTAGSVRIALTPDNSQWMYGEETVKMLDIIYLPALYSAGLDALAEHAETESFEGVIEPNTTFQYKDDYFLGDIVNVSNDFGISIDARIVEIIEVDDENGYNVEPSFEYKIMGV